MRSHFETITAERRANGILLVTLNRPEAANALNTQMGLDLMELFEHFSIDLEGLRIAILTGAGSKAFCAGGDLKQRNGMTDEAWQAQHLIFERMLRAILACPIPVIAAVNGAAYGGGCEIAAAADFIYASDNARFALTEVTLGIMPGAGGTQNLPRAIGERRAKELILSGLPFSAAEAEAWGLVNRVLPPDELMKATFAIAERIAGNGADLGAPGQAGDPSRPADVARRRIGFRDRSVQPPGADRRPPRRRARLQRAPQAGFQGTMSPGLLRLMPRRGK